MVISQFRHGTRPAAMLLLFLLLLTAQAAQAQTRPAGNPIFSSRLRHIVEMIPGSATDLPLYLTTSRDVYLLITAGASYTEIVVLANPEVSPPAVARALASSLAGTPLGGQTVEWSADRYSAAQVTAHSSCFGRVRGSNTAAFGPLVSGLRRAGFAPHLLLRVPRYAQSSLPPPHYGTANFRWYDAHHLGGQNSVTVSARLSPLALGGLTAYCLLVPIAGLAGLWLAPVLSGRLSGAAARLRFRRVGTFAFAGALMVQMGGLFYWLRTPTTSALADLWFGSSSVAAIVPFLVAGAVISPLFLILAHKQELRRFGPLPVPAAIPMSDEEKATRKRVAQWSALPHFVGAVALGAVPFFVPRTSPLYTYIHPISIFLPMLGAALVAKIFQKRLDKFTLKTLDDDLTWRARQLGQALGVRMPDVLVEDSSRAAHLAFASHQGHHITLSRKLQETFTPAETDFVLAHHLACMKRRRRGDARWMKSLLTLPMLLPVLLILSSKPTLGTPILAAVILSPWFLPGIIGYFGLFLVLTIVLAGNSSQRQRKQDADADRDALEVTGNITAAESALEKMAADEMSMMTPAGKALALNPAQMKGVGQAGQILLRRLELRKAAAALHFAPAPGATQEAASEERR